MRELEMFKAPKFELAPRRVVEIPFSGPIAAGVFDTLDSGRIMYPFRITQVKMIFTDEANNWIRHEWRVSARARQSATEPLSGRNIFGPESPTASFVGKGIIRVVPCNIEFPEGGVIIHFYTQNLGPYIYERNASVTIEEM